MKDMQASLEKLRADAAEAALVRDLATSPGSGPLHDVGRPLSKLADEVEKAVEEKRAPT